MRNQFNQFCQFVRNDFASHPWRFAAETWNWISGLIAAVIFAITAPNVPFLITYPVWLSGTILNIFCARSRGSFGVMMMAVSMTIIDIYGFTRVLLQS
jgi:hypothetical protein